MHLVHFPRSLTAFARLGLAFVMVALTLLGSVRPAAASSISATPSGSGFKVSGLGSQILFYGLQQPYINSSGSLAWPSGSDVKYIIGNGSSVQFLGGLRPNTTYYWAVPNNYGTLGRTLQRRVDISFNSITVTNDSDSTGAGELYYFFKVGGVYHSELNFYRSTSATVTFNPGKSISGIFNGDSYMELLVEIVDDDCTFSTCKPTNPTFSRYGDNGDFEWATAGQGAAIDFSNLQTNYVQFQKSYSANEFVMAFSGTALVTVWYY
jgi:hypothetical protein